MALDGRGRAAGRDGAVSAVLGGVLMLALMMTLVPGAVLLRQAMSDEMDAQREAAERAAFCARHPGSKAMGCDKAGPLPGYACEQAATDVFVCVPEELDPHGLPDLVPVPQALRDGGGGGGGGPADPAPCAPPQPCPGLAS